MDIKLSQQEALIDSILHINRIQELQELLVKLRVLVKVQKKVDYKMLIQSLR